MATPLKVHRRQFVICRESPAVPADYLCVPLPDGQRLWHDPALPVRHLRTARGEEWLLGSLVSITADPEEIEMASGRFVRICWPWLETDASGLLAVMYSAGPTGVRVTSSPGLAKECFGAADEPRALRKPGINWQPSPASPLAGWPRLFADQRICLASGRIEHVAKTLNSHLDEPQAIGRLRDGLAHYGRNLGRQYGSVLLPLTAGLDSRTIFSALVAGGTPFRCFTQVFGQRSTDDAATAKEICRRFGVPHEVIEGLPADPAASAMLARHGGNSVLDADVETLYPGHFYRFLRPGEVMVRGGIFELGQRDYLGKFLGFSFDDDDLGRHIADAFDEPEGSPMADMMEQWARHRRVHDLGLDFIDAFFFDHDIGGWLSAIEQGLDMLPGTSLHPKNSTHLMSWLMSTSPDRRRQGVIQRQVIAGVDRRLADIAYNPYERNRRLIRGSLLETVAIAVRNRLRRYVRSR